MSSPLPATYWAQADAMIKYVGEQMGGLDKLKGKKIGLVYHRHRLWQGADRDARKAVREARLRPSSNTPVSAPGIEQ